jgi:hypothetical protein
MEAINVLGSVKIGTGSEARSTENAPPDRAAVSYRTERADTRPDAAPVDEAWHARILP